MKKKRLSVFVLSLLMVLQVGTTTYAGSVCKQPMIKKIEQTSTNQLKITYTEAADQGAATDPSHYWIQTSSSSKPKGIATLGKKGKISQDNTLTPEQVQISPEGLEGTEYILTFTEDIPSDEKYKLIICYVTVPYGAPYEGDNGAVDFIGE